jgi:hypothetical protein
VARILWLSAALLAPLAASAQVIAPTEVISVGTSYFIYAEPGAPTVQVAIVGEGTRPGIYVVEDGTTLSELLALAGGTARSSETERQIIRAIVRVLREQGGRRAVVYQADAEELYLEPAAHPDLQDGDLIDVDVEYEEIDEPFTLREGLEIASRVASLVSVILLLYLRTDNL